MVVPGVMLELGFIVMRMELDLTFQLTAAQEEAAVKEEVITGAVETQEAQDIAVLLELVQAQLRILGRENVERHQRIILKF